MIPIDYRLTFDDLALIATKDANDADAAAAWARFRAVVDAIAPKPRVLRVYVERESADRSKDEQGA
jgi:hypothetical protein